jgi:hypothetical protein
LLDREHAVIAADSFGGATFYSIIAWGPRPLVQRIKKEIALLRSSRANTSAITRNDGETSSATAQAIETGSAPQKEPVLCRTAAPSSKFVPGS